MLKSLNVNQERLAYFDNERPDAPTIIFVHGNSHSQEVFEAQFDSFLGQKYRLIGVDLPGHGQSSWHVDPSLYSLPSYGRVLASFIELLGLTDVFLAGHSLGGHIALEAARLLPQIRGVFVWGTPPVRDLSDVAGAFHPNEAVAGLFKADLSDSEVELVARGCYAEGSPLWQRSWEMIRKSDPFAREALAQEVQKGNFSDEKAVLQALGRRIAVAHGEQDALVNRAFFQGVDLSSTFAGELVNFAGVGHSAHIEDPASFNQSLAIFCQTLLAEEAPATALL